MDVTLGDSALIGSVLAVTLILARIIEKLIEKKFGRRSDASEDKKDNNSAALTAEIIEHIHNDEVSFAEQKMLLKQTRESVEVLRESELSTQRSLTDMTAANHRTCDRIGDLITSINQLIMKEHN
jgi:hypothetical protein